MLEKYPKSNIQLSMSNNENYPNKLCEISQEVSNMVKSVKINLKFSCGDMFDINLFCYKNLHCIYKIYYSLSKQYNSLGVKIGVFTPFQNHKEKHFNIFMNKFLACLFPILLYIRNCIKHIRFFIFIFPPRSKIIY